MTEIPEEAVGRAAKAIDPTAFDLSQPNHNGATRRYRRDRATDLARRALSAAALPHLRVQETPVLDLTEAEVAGLNEQIADTSWVQGEDADLETADDVERRDGWYRLAVNRGQGDEFIAMLAHERRLPASRDERTAAPHPRPVVDREALADRLHRATCMTSPSEHCTGPKEVDYVRADAVLALLPTEEGEGS